MNDWIRTLLALRDAGEPCVLVTVAQARGSTPREAGTKMLVTREQVHGTIGGGTLEFKSIEIARATLGDGNLERAPVTLRRFPLGPGLGQCCGGVAVLLFEPVSQLQDMAWLDRLAVGAHGTNGIEPVAMLTLDGATPDCAKLLVTADHVIGAYTEEPLLARAVARARSVLERGGDAELFKLKSMDALARPRCKTTAGETANVLIEPVRSADFHVVLFGAGHVGRALVNVLGRLRCTIDWVDARAEQFPAELPANVCPLITERPELAAIAAPPGSFFLIMTHSHPLDLSICNQVLRRGDSRYCGLIGSVTKRNRFRKRLLDGGLCEDALTRLTCPIGVAGITGKHPTEIAVAVSAQLLQVRERPMQPHGTTGLRSLASTEA